MDPENPQPQPSVTPAGTGHQCDECAAPVEEEQRYCVVCGAHRRHVGDPATRYLSQKSARRRTARAAATARRRPGGSGLRGLGVALGLALIPAAAAVGVLAERSSNGSDGHLIAALSREQAALARADAVGSGSGTGTSTGTGASTAVANRTSSPKATKQRHRTTKAHKDRTHHAKVASAAANPTATTATPVSTAKATAKQKATGAAATQKVQKSKGASYVHGQSSLPGTVVVP